MPLISLWVDNSKKRTKKEEEVVLPKKKEGGRVLQVVERVVGVVTPLGRILVVKC